MTVFWAAAPCSLVHIDRRCRGAYCLYHQGDKCRALVNLYQNTQRKIPEDSHLPLQSCYSKGVKPSGCATTMLLTFMSDRQTDSVMVLWKVRSAVLVRESESLVCTVAKKETSKHRQVTVTIMWVKRSHKNSLTLLQGMMKGFPQAVDVPRASELVGGDEQHACIELAWVLQRWRGVHQDKGKSYREIPAYYNPPWFHCDENPPRN
jgi:hypothetical protein